MKYEINDLKYIYVRVGVKNTHVEEMSDNDFVKWAQDKFQVKIQDDDTVKGTPWSLQDRTDFLNDMSARYGGGHVVVMIKH